MVTLPRIQDLDTLSAIRDLERFGWTKLDKFDPRRCLEAGWILAHDGGYRLTGTGRQLLRASLLHEGQLEIERHWQLPRRCALTGCGSPIA